MQAPQPVSDPSSPAVADKQRRLMLRAALTGAIATIGMLGLQQPAQAQQRISLASLQQDINNLSTQLAATNIGLDDLEASIAAVVDMVDSILDGSSPAGSVFGRVRLASSSVPSDASNLGELRYNTQRVEVSGPTGWSALAPASATGQTFIRYGNLTAPAGTELIATGNVWVGVGSTMFMPASPESGPFAFVNGPSLSRVVVSLNPSILGSALMGAQCWAPRPVAVFWGRSTPPAGWTTLYSGIAMTSDSNGNVKETLLVDSNYQHLSSISGSLISNIIDFSQGQPRITIGILAMRDA